MSDDRFFRDSPEAQVLTAMAEAKRDGLDPLEAWQLAVNGHICDSYTSARGDKPEPQRALGGPPNLRPSHAPPPPDDPDDDVRTSEQRCAGCRFIAQPGRGLARCTLYDSPVFGGVLWPHRTEERQAWKNAIVGTAPEWIAAYADEPTPVQRLLDVIAAASLDVADAEHDGHRGQVAA